MAEGRDEITRRDFVSRAAQTAAGVAVGGSLLGATRAQGTPTVNSRVLGANDRVVVASIGIRSQGNGLKRGFAKLDNVEVKTLCDVDENLFASRANDPALAGVPRFKPGYVQDLRRVLEDRDIDAVVVATPNHWHALATIWAIQAGKHVYVEKPASHTVWEGRQMVEAARKHNRMVQVGTNNRSAPAVRQALQFLHEGGLGEVYMARGLCYKPRPSIGRYPDGPMAPGERYRLNAEARADEPAYDEAYLAKVDYDLWLGPASRRAFNRNRFHYNWHWHWEYGNGDTGNQGPHQFDVARWGLGQGEHPVKISSAGGLFGVADSSQETPNLHSTLFTYANGKVLEFATRGTYSNEEGTQRIGNLFYGTKGWLWIDGGGESWQSYFGRKDEKGPGRAGTTDGDTGTSTAAPASALYPHLQNFVDAIRAGDRKKLNCEIEEGHLSSSLPHLANIAYRVGRSLTFDGARERFVNDREADALLTRSYRAPFVVPEKI
jgi:predicted dehydrogenase